jgi:hypothetical protein
VKPYGSKRSFDTEPRIKSGRALVKREGEALIDEAEELLDLERELEALPEFCTRECCLEKAPS